MKKILLHFSVILFSISCTGPLDKGDYIRFIRNENNGLRKVSQHEGYFFDLQYQPSDYVFLQRNGDKLSSPLQSSLKDEIKSLQYYTLTIGLAKSNEDFITSGTNSLKERQQKIHYFSYPFQNEIYLMEGEVKLTPVLYHFERSVDLNNSRTFVLGFENVHEYNHSSTLVIQENIFLNKAVLLEINKSNQPKLRL